MGYRCSYLQPATSPPVSMGESGQEELHITKRSTTSWIKYAVLEDSLVRVAKRIERGLHPKNRARLDDDDGSKQCLSTMFTNELTVRNTSKTNIEHCKEIM